MNGTIIVDSRIGNNDLTGRIRIQGHHPVLSLCTPPMTVYVARRDTVGGPLRIAMGPDYVEVVERLQYADNFIEMLSDLHGLACKYDNSKRWVN